MVPPGQGLLLPLITFPLHQTVPCDPHPLPSHPYLVIDESQRCGGSNTIKPLVGVNLTEWGWCHLARGCYCPSSPLPFTRRCPQPPTSHPFLVRVESQRCGGSSTIIPLVGVNLTKWGGCHLARGCCCPSSPLPFTRLCHVTPILPPATPAWSEMNH